MSDGAFHALVGILRPCLPRPGLFAEVRTALALRYMGGGSYVDMCAAFGVHSASVYRHCGQLPCRAPRWVFPTEGGWGGTVCSLKGRRVGRVAAKSVMQRGESPVGCGVDFSGMFAAACVATPAKSFRIVDNSFDSSCKRGIINTRDVEFPVLRRYTAV